MKKFILTTISVILLTGCTFKITSEDLPEGFSDGFVSRNVEYQENVAFSDTNALCTISVKDVEDDLDYIDSEAFDSIADNLTISNTGVTLTSIDSTSRYICYENNGLKLGNPAYKYGGLLKLNFENNFTKVKIKCHARVSYVFHETETETRIESNTSLNANGSKYIKLKDTYEDGEDYFYYTYFSLSSTNSLTINTNSGNVIIKEIVLY